jgi:DNA-directed RNA polymerase subunit A'
MREKRIQRIQFGLLSPKEIRKMSATKIITADTYSEDGFPIEMGLMDSRLGVIDPGLRCKTCGNRIGECPGHFGHIELAAPIVHVGYAKQIYKILGATCRKCGKLLLDEKERKNFSEEIKRQKEKQVNIDKTVKKIFKDASKRAVCMYCGELQGQIKYERPLSYIEIEEDKEETRTRRLTPTDVRERLEKIPDEDVSLLGMVPKKSRPEWMVLTVLPVPPATARPSITLESGQRSEDDLTHKLVDIIRINQRFVENRDAGAPQLIIEDLWELLQYHVATLFDNEITGLPPARHRSGRPLKTLSQRLKGKEGRFRGSLSGKRVNFSARTVISPDLNIGVDEVGVPEAIAKELTIMENVIGRNREEMREIIKNMRANYVRRADGKKVKITEKNYADLIEQINVGWKVERHIRDGDIVLFNRQPSLHRLSLMAHYVKVMPGKTFRLNPAVCPPYNADYDGDEMNLHVLQTDEARAEAKMLMEVQKNIISPRFGSTIIGGMHDYITGLFLLTWREKKFKKEEVLTILRKIDIECLPEPGGKIEDASRGEVPYWTGKQIFSAILPQGLNIEFRGEICNKCVERGEECMGERCPYDAYVIIKNGELVRGTIDEKGIGAFKGEIINRVYREYGGNRTKKFIGDGGRLAANYILLNGFSFGISDEDMPEEAREQIAKEVLHNAVTRVNELITAYERGELGALPGRTVEETLELMIIQELARARDEAGDIAEKYLGMENSGVLMAKSGARGSMLNLTQMVGCVGQQSVRGERIKRGYNERTLPHFRRGDLSANAHGFVKSSFKDGLSPTEYFFHAIGGREALVDTAVRTSQSGYFQRRLINALQDLEVKYDETVRETRGLVVQFKYGEDGVYPAKSDYGKVVDIEEIIKETLETGREMEPEAKAPV